MVGTVANNAVDDQENSVLSEYIREIAVLLLDIKQYKQPRSSWPRERRWKYILHILSAKKHVTQEDVR